MEILHKLGIDWKLLIAQGVNFVVLLYVLRRFAYKPMLAFLDERQQKIETGLTNATKATEKLAEAEKEHRALLNDAKKEARALVEAALVAAKERDQESLDKTKGEVAALLALAQTEIAHEKNKMLREAKEELAEVVLLATEKMVHEKVDASKDKELVLSLLKD
jgi:F-type H+-transporting ATPase subunit b